VDLETVVPSESVESLVSDRPPKRRSLLSRLAGFAVGVALFGAAIWIVLDNKAQFLEAWQTARSRSWLLIAFALALPLGNWLLVSVSFWLLMKRRGTVGPWEMSALVGNALLLNYLPLRPGMVSRLTWHKVVNGIGFRDSAVVMAICVGFSVSCSVLLLLIAVALGPRAHWAVWLATLSVPVVIAMGYGQFSASQSLARAMSHVFVLRYLDMLVWAGRYAASFELVGTPVGLPGAIALAAVSQVAMMAPVSGNGLGLREWLIGISASLLPAALVTSNPDRAVGLAADLVNRAAELVVSLPVGLLSGAWLARQYRRWRRARREEQARGRPPDKRGRSSEVASDPHPTDGLGRASGVESDDSRGERDIQRR